VASECKVTLPDLSERTYPHGTSFEEVAKSIGPGLWKAALGVKIDGTIYDVTKKLEQDAKIEFVTARTEEGVDIIRHSTAHVLAMAVQKLWPGTQVTIGPVIENGFFYDFAFKQGIKLSETDLPKIEEEMARIIKEDYPVVREVVSKAPIIKAFTEMGELFKVEIIQEFPEDSVISVYKMGGWYDLCTGPHVPRTGAIPAFKLLSIA
jgi:threonyl-tRNA synthetase